MRLSRSSVTPLQIETHTTRIRPLDCDTKLLIDQHQCLMHVCNECLQTNKNKKNPIKHNVQHFESCSCDTIYAFLLTSFMFPIDIRLSHPTNETLRARPHTEYSYLQFSGRLGMTKCLTKTVCMLRVKRQVTLARATTVYVCQCALRAWSSVPK